MESGFGSFNTKYGMVSVNGGVENFMGYNFSVSEGETDGYLRNNYQKNKNINGHVSFYLPKDMTLSFGVKHANVEYGFPVLNDPSRSDLGLQLPHLQRDRRPTAPRAVHHVQYAGPPEPYWTRDVTYQDLILTVPALGGELQGARFFHRGQALAPLLFRNHLHQ